MTTVKIKTTLLLFTLLSFGACTSEENRPTNSPNEITIDSNVSNQKFKLADERTIDEKALDALTNIQVSGSALYLTFANSYHRCKGEIGTYTITDTEFENVLLDLLERYYPNFSTEEKANLAFIAKLPKSEYTFTICAPSITTLTPEDSIVPPQIGMWIFQSYTVDTDLVILW